MSEVVLVDLENAIEDRESAGGVSDVPQDTDRVTVVWGATILITPGLVDVSGGASAVVKHNPTRVGYSVPCPVSFNPLLINGTVTQLVEEFRRSLLETMAKVRQETFLVDELAKYQTWLCGRGIHADTDVRTAGQAVAKTP